MNKQETGTIPHTAVIYPNRRYRNKSIESCLGVPRACWRSLTVLSAQPSTDISFFKGRERKKAARGALPHASVIDVRDTLVRNRDPAGSIISLLKEIRRDGTGGSPALVIGDWVHQTYDDFGVALTVEESENEEANTVCCYREEGFWSLDCEHIARIFELHSRVMFGSSIFKMGKH